MTQSFTFAGLEGGRQGRPVELYRFQFGNTEYRYVSSEVNFIFDGLTYTAIPIKSSEPTKNPQERRSNTIEIVMPADQDFVPNYQGVQPAVDLTVKIYRVQLDESSSAFFESPLSDTPTTSYVRFSGQVNSVKFRGREAVLVCHPLNNNLQRETPRIAYQSLCNHVLYDARCQVLEGSFSQSGLVSGVSGNVITINGFTGNSFTGGYIQNAAGDDFRSVLVQDDDQFTLLLPFAENPTGTTVTAFQGCDHSIQTCKDKFNNVENFGGFPYIPEKNPFNQSQFTKS